MKAIRVHQFGGPEVMQLEEVPTLHAGPGQVLVRVHAAGINPVDTYIRSGAYAAKPVLPYTPGKDAGGVVEAVGEGVRQVKPGDRVYVGDSLTGTYADYALCLPAQLHPLPQQVTFSQGAAVNVPYATAYRALFQRAKAVAGETVLVHGATGGVGIASVQLARAAGLTIIGTGGTEAGRRLVTEQGAQHVLDHRSPDYLRQILELTGGRGVDVILEMASHINLGKDLTVLARDGRLAVVGSRGPVEINPRDAMSRDANILGVMLNNASEKELAGIHAALVAGLENGTLRPVIRKELPLAEAALGHQLVMEPGSWGKIVLVP
ncbi:MAG: quinone oxidoreductase [Pedosphaera sp.]|nr:quinone oxidoreductase [Pedosphaera sp.]